MIKNKILSKCEKCENIIKRCFFKQKFNIFYVEELYHIVESLYCIILFLFSDYMTLMTKLNIVKMKNGKISEKSLFKAEKSYYIEEMQSANCIIILWYYISLFTIFRLHEFDDQVKWVREGMAKVVPVPLLSLFTGLELETMVR